MPSAPEVKQPLSIPPTHAERLKHARKAQQYFGNRFPTRQEFARFLQANARFEFDESCYYECSMSYCAGGPVSEGYNTDVDGNPPEWFRQFERATGADGAWTGRQLLELLQGLPE